MRITISNDQIQWIISEIQSFYLRERQENISENEAQKLFDFVKETLSPILYNAILYDVFRIIENQCDHLEREILNLEKPNTLNNLKFN